MFLEARVGQKKRLYCMIIVMAMCYFSLSICMNNKLDLATDARYALVVNDLKQKYSNYLARNLENYKTQPVNLNDLASKAVEMTGLVVGKGILQTIKDKDDNGFAHIAVGKQDKVAVRWLCKSQGFLFLKENKDSKSPLGLCFDQLEPDRLIGSKNNALTIMSCIVTSLGKQDNNVYDDEKSDHLRKMIGLKVAYDCLGVQIDGFKFVCDDNLLRCLVPHNQLHNAPQLLEFWYKEAAAKIDSTLFLHKFVEECDAQGLFDFLSKNASLFKDSASKKNSKGMALIDIAENNFAAHLGDIESIGFSDENFKKSRCCLFIVLNYMRLNNGKKKGVFHFCCDKHRFESDECGTASSHESY